MHFVVAEYGGLVPGLNYLFRIRGINEAGCGPWSDHTYSTFTVATAPAVPKPPHIAEATLRSILFAWEPPNNGGSAITGYDIILKNLDNKMIALPRSSVSYLWEGLFPGRSYFIRVQARNEVGESGFSDWNNADTDAQTVIGPPDTPGNPRAVAGTWNSITLECRLSYDNGSRITGLQLERRMVDPFNIGDWEYTNEIGTMIGQVTYRGEGICKVPGQVTMVEFVDPDLQQLELEQAVRALELSISSSGFNPYAKDKNKTLQEIEQLITSQVMRKTRATLHPIYLYLTVRTMLCMCRGTSRVPSSDSKWAGSSRTSCTSSGCDSSIAPVKGSGAFPHTGGCSRASPLAYHTILHCLALHCAVSCA